MFRPFMLNGAAQMPFHCMDLSIDTRADMSQLPSFLPSHPPAVSCGLCTGHLGDPFDPDLAGALPTPPNGPPPRQRFNTHALKQAPRATVSGTHESGNQMREQKTGAEDPSDQSTFHMSST